MRDPKKFKSIAFDLDTKKLQELYTDSDWHNAYKDLGDYLEDNGFKRQQGSVFDSKIKMDNVELSNFIDTIPENFPWFPECLKSIRSYDQPKIVDYTDQIKSKFLVDQSKKQEPPKETTHTIKRKR